MSKKIKNYDTALFEYTLEPACYETRAIFFDGSKRRPWAIKYLLVAFFLSLLNLLLYFRNIPELYYEILLVFYMMLTVLIIVRYSIGAIWQKKLCYGYVFYALLLLVLPAIIKGIYMLFCIF